LRLLLDTNALAWFLLDLPSLPQTAKAAIADPDNTVVVSAVSALEIAIKVRIGKWPEAAPIVQAFDRTLEAEQFQALSVSVEHALKAGAMSGVHRDPFDRLLIAQALVEDLILVSNEAVFDGFGVQRLW
jgi:PIN domain nuclease of toxin-antitoxin system